MPTAHSHEPGGPTAPLCNRKFFLLSMLTPFSGHACFFLISGDGSMTIPSQLYHLLISLFPGCIHTTPEPLYPRKDSDQEREVT